MLTRLWRDQRGAAALELAVLAPLAILILTALVDHGLMVQRALRLEAAARAGVEVLANMPGTGGFTPAIATAKLAAGSTDATAIPSQSCTCPGAVASASCSTIACPGGANPTVHLHMVVQQGYAPLFSYPWMAGSPVLTGEATVRVQ